MIGEGRHDELRTDPGESARERHARRRVERLALVRVVGSIVAVVLILVLGVGEGNALGATASWDVGLRADSIVDEATDLVAALPYGELEAMDGASIQDWRRPGEPAFRVELAVAQVATGLRVRATLVDARTREAIRDFVAWRGRR